MTEDGVEVTMAAFSTAKESLPDQYPRDTLEREFRAGSRELGVRDGNVLVYDYPVRNLHAHRQAILETLVSLRKKLDPELVFAPSLHDVHQDHQVLFAEARRAFNDRSLWGYELPWNHVRFDGQAFVVLDARHVEKKWKALTHYKSQFELGRPYFHKETIEGLARVRGLAVKATFAEAFEVTRFKWALAGGQP